MGDWTTATYKDIGNGKHEKTVVFGDGIRTVSEGIKIKTSLGTNSFVCDGTLKRFVNDKLVYTALIRSEKNKFKVRMNPIFLDRKWYYENGNMLKHFTYDELGRKHGEWVFLFPSGAVRDKKYFYKDRQITEPMWKNPQQFTIEDIFSEKNTETRRCMIELMGYDVFLNRMGKRSEIIDENPDPKIGTLYKVIIDGQSNKFLKVKDGTLDKHYILCVPPRFTNAKEANAWTWGKSDKTYNPMKET